MNDINHGLSGKVALVTGGSRGIGLEIARQLLKENALVAICGRKEDGLEAAAKSLGQPENLLTIKAHIAKEVDVEQMISAVLSKFSRLDMLFNNVGMNLLTSSLADTEPSLWQKIIDSNLNGTFLVSRKAASLMKTQGSGKIVSISSIAGRKASAGMGVYGIAKAGIEMMTKVLAAELAPMNIQVNAVAPGMVRTDFSKPFWSNEQLYQEICKGIPAKRIAEVEEVVHPALFLASEGARFITGHILVVDGGQTIA